MFTPDLARCAIHWYAPSSGSAEFHSVALVAPGMGYEQGVELPFAEDYCEESLEALAISPDGRWLLAGHACGWVSRWDLGEAKPGKGSVPDAEPLTLAQEDEEEWGGADPTALAVSPDGRRLATGDSAGEVRLYGFRSRKQVATLQPPAAKGRASAG